MLVNLHVKNMAIIDEIDVDFNKHLNILTGETGAGKSILVGSINIALGARVFGDMIRKGAEYGMVELVFFIEREETREKLRQMDIFPEDGQIVISRKIMENRSVNKINGENVSLATIKQVAQLCIDIHGQHEHQSLLQKNRHLQIVDEYVKDELEEPLHKLRGIYKEYLSVREELSENEIPEEERARQVSFLEYEKNEIESANLEAGEEDTLEEEYQRLSHGEAIVQALGAAYGVTGEGNGAAGNVGYALRELASVTRFDEKVEQFHGQLQEIENLINDFNHDISEYIQDASFDEERYHQVEERLALVRTIINRFGGDYESVMNYLNTVDEKLSKYVDYDAYITKQRAALSQLEAQVSELSSHISEIRKKGAMQLEKKIMDALADLNFADARFSIHFDTLPSYTAHGTDDVEFQIATNPGEDLKPLVKIASGGELSRIMLAIKSVFADTDQIETLIFDEIDVGISGRTAQKVSEKMSVLGKNHQIICITHLAQIAAMADTHYVIRKNVSEERAHTEILALSDADSIQELARIMGGAQITDTVLTGAKEMKELAAQTKNYTV